MQKILVVDADAQTRRVIRADLENAGYTVIEAIDGQSGLRAFYDSQPSLVILDSVLPNLSGWEVCKRLRLVTDIPIILLSGLASDEDIINGYENGATYYVTKPFKASHLLGRLQVALNQKTHTELSKREQYSDEHLTINLAKREVFVQGRLITLSATEYSLLAYLVQNVGQTLSFRQILDHVWYQGAGLKPERVHTVIWRLRNKIEEDSKKPIYLITEYGLGYRFEILR